MGRTFTQDQLESILKIYFSREREELLTPESLDMIGGFLQFCKVKDILNNTDTLLLLKQFYGSENEKTTATDKCIFMSAASRFRFKKSVFELFNKYLASKYAS